MAFLKLELVDGNKFHVCHFTSVNFIHSVFRRKQLLDFVVRDLAYYNIKSGLKIKTGDIYIVLSFSNRSLSNEVMIYFLYKHQPEEYPFIYHLRYVNDYKLKLFIKNMFYKDSWLGFENNLDDGDVHALDMIDIWNDNVKFTATQY